MGTIYERWQWFEFLAWELPKLVRKGEDLAAQSQTSITLDNPED